MQKKPSLGNILLIVFIGLLSTVGGILSNVASSNIPPVVKPYLGLAWPLLGIVAVVLIVLSIWQTAHQSTTEPLTPSITSQNRQRMLARVQAFWIKGVLEQSLHGAALIALGLTERQDAIANPWHLVIYQPDHSVRPLPPGTRITQIYDDADGELLILGEPGSGKTTLMLELVRDLLDRARKDDTHPMPVVFNLSSWAVKHQPISDWIVEEMNTKYQVPLKLAQSWVDGDQILPLLDGLDEVEQKHREACLGAINDYHKEHMMPLVVCSRSSEYFAQSTHVSLRNAVIVQPLTKQQIDDYLWRAGGQMEAVRISLHNDPYLLELAETPLMLSVLSLAFHGISIEGLVSAGSPETRRKQIFAAYTRRMLQRRGTKTRYTQQKTIHMLAWLARQLVQHGQTQFHIERIQKDWLTKRKCHSYQLYEAIVTRLVTGLVSGLAIGLVSGLVELVSELCFASVSGLALFKSVYGLTNELNAGLAGLIIGFIFGTIFGVIGGIEREIKPAETIFWSWTSMRRGLINNFRKGLILGLGLGLLTLLASLWFGLSIFGLGSTLYGGLLFGALFGVTFGALFGVSFALIGGLSSATLSERNLTKPNRGIWLSARNGILFGLVGGLIFGLVGNLAFQLLFYRYAYLNLLIYYFLFNNFTLYPDLTQMVFIFTFVGALGLGLTNGGRACIEHLVLRLFLWRAGYAPWNYPSFLDYAADRILLRKVGGGYIFVHRLLQDYFASLGTVPTTAKKSKQSKNAKQAS